MAPTPYHSNSPVDPQFTIVSPPISQASSQEEWSQTIKKAKQDSMQRRARVQEKNRIAAVKSRQRKKAEWERLVNAEVALLDENMRLKARVAELERQLHAK